MMGKKRRIVCLANVDLAYANGGVEYLCNTLVDEGHDVSLIAPHAGATLAALIGRCKADVYGAMPGGILNVRRFRWIAYRLLCRRLLKALRPFDIVVFTNYLFLADVFFVRQLCPDSRLVHYALEFYRPNETWPLPFLALQRDYRNAIPLFDLHIDVDPYRAKLRKAEFNLPNDPLVLPNTVPLGNSRGVTGDRRLDESAGFERHRDRPVLLYAGGNGKVNGIDVILDALARIKWPFMFVAFMYEGGRTNAEVYELAKRKVGGGRVRVVNALPREVLRAVAGQADCAIGYYDVSVSTNFKYCAPTKVYEYIACGLPVVFSPNPSMIDLLERNGLGVCADECSPQSLKQAIEHVLFDPVKLMTMRRLAGRLFEDELCFEKACRPVVEAINCL